MTRDDGPFHVGGVIVAPIAILNALTLRACLPIVVRSRAAPHISGGARNNGFMR
jgi:hypothetical protein